VLHTFALHLKPEVFVADTAEDLKILCIDERCPPVTHSSVRHARTAERTDLSVSCSDVPGTASAHLQAGSNASSCLSPSRLSFDARTPSPKHVRVGRCVSSRGNLPFLPSPSLHKGVQRHLHRPSFLLLLPRSIFPGTTPSFHFRTCIDLVACGAIGVPFSYTIEALSWSDPFALSFMPLVPQE